MYRNIAFWIKFICKQHWFEKESLKLPNNNYGALLMKHLQVYYHICSYKIIKMNWLNGRFSFIYFVYNIHHLNTEIENLNYFLGEFLIKVTFRSVIQYTSMPVLLFWNTFTHVLMSIFIWPEFPVVGNCTCLQNSLARFPDLKRETSH
jgi:hypothetical protein